MRWEGPPSPLRPRAGFSFSQEPLKLINTEGQPTWSLRKLALAKMYGSRDAGSGVVPSGDVLGPWARD